jgi:hypothetical protein
MTWDTPESVIEQQLGRGERLLWSGQPRGGVRFHLADVVMIPFSLMWCGFAVVWETVVITKGAPLFFAIWGVPFVLVGLYLVFGRFFVDAWTRNRTFYGLTGERIIIVGGLSSRQIKSMQLRTLNDISLTERTDGSGTITFGPQFPMMPEMFAGWPGAGRFGPPAFDMIDSAKEVYDLIRKTQKTAE